MENLNVIERQHPVVVMCVSEQSPESEARVSAVFNNFRHLASKIQFMTFTSEKTNVRAHLFAEAQKLQTKRTPTMLEVKRKVLLKKVMIAIDNHQYCQMPEEVKRMLDLAYGHKFSSKEAYYFPWGFRC